MCWATLQFESIVFLLTDKLYRTVAFFFVDKRCVLHAVFAIMYSGYQVPLLSLPELRSCILQRRVKGTRCGMRE